MEAAPVDPSRRAPEAPEQPTALGGEARISGYVLMGDNFYYKSSLSEIIISSVGSGIITVTGDDAMTIDTFFKIFVSEPKNPKKRHFGVEFNSPARQWQPCDIPQLRLDIHYTRGSDKHHTKLVIAVEDEQLKTDFLRDFGLVRADIESRPGGGLLVDRISDWGPGKFSADEMCGEGNFFRTPCSVLRLKKGKTGGTFPQIIGARHVGLPLQSNLTIGIGRVRGEDGPATHGIIHVDNSGQPELITAGDHMFTKIHVRKTDKPRQWDDGSICNHQLRLDITFLDVENKEQQVKLLIAFAGWGAGEGTRLYPGKDTEPEAAMIAEKNNFLAEIIKLVEKGGHELFTIDEKFGIDDGMDWNMGAFQQYSTAAASARRGGERGKQMTDMTYPEQVPQVTSVGGVVAAVEPSPEPAQVTQPTPEERQESDEAEVNEIRDELTLAGWGPEPMLFSVGRVLSGGDKYAPLNNSLIIIGTRNVLGMTLMGMIQMRAGLSKGLVLPTFNQDGSFVRMTMREPKGGKTRYWNKNKEALMHGEEIQHLIRLDVEWKSNDIIAGHRKLMSIKLLIAWHRGDLKDEFIANFQQLNSGFPAIFVLGGMGGGGKKSTRRTKKRRTKKRRNTKRRTKKRRTKKRRNTKRRTTRRR
tara:strand:+ start:155 stop:2074 length:1920 start_codon:yes stop_codon:yes gene_type:complete